MALKHSMVASFLPKLSTMQTGSGAHLHFSIWKASACCGSLPSTAACPCWLNVSERGGRLSLCVP